MLTNLRIINFAIIDTLEITFKGGLTVLTGETGAGKSIIIDALDFLLGARGSIELIRNGTSKAQVEGTFFISSNLYSKKIKHWLQLNGFETSQTLILSRELTKEGSKGRINGSLANVSHLLFLREYLINIHMQSEHTELLNHEGQLEILDNFGNNKHKSLVEDYKEIFYEYQNIKTKFNYYRENSQAIQKKLDFLNFQVKEIKGAKINNLNEDNELESRREVLLNKKELLENANFIYELINGENQNNLLSSIAQIKKLTTKSLEYDKSFEPYNEVLESITTQLKDFSSFVKSYTENLNEENELVEIEQRLDLIYNLKKKYGKTLEEIKQYLSKIEHELNELQSYNSSQDDLEKVFKTKELEINALGDKLTTSREKVAKDFVNKVHEELLTLGFNVGAPLIVVESTPCELSQKGKEQIQFLFSANPDESPKPLVKVASGGELSRIILGIKSVDTTENFSTLVFDEIDIGVSGEIAASVAKKLYKISIYNQLIAITHQPIIVAMADNHFVIEKFLKGESTQVFVREILKDKKAEALAILLTPENKRAGGITEDAKTFARSLIENASRVKGAFAVRAER